MRFTVSFFLIFTAFAGISLVGIIATHEQFAFVPGRGAEFHLFSFLFWAPEWTPLLFAAFAVGRRALSGKLIVIFAVAEALAIAAMLAVFRSFK